MSDYISHLKTSKKVPDEYIHPAIKSKQWELICSSIEKNGVMLDLLTFPLVTEKFCRDIIESAEKTEKWQTDRHKNYPTYDKELKTFGWGMIYQNIFDEYVQPLVNNIWQIKTSNMMNCENFIARYTPDNQDYLAVHNDESSYSCLVALNDDFEGGGTFYPRQNIEVNLKPGYALVHPELNYRHGGRAITKGVRYIIVTFCKRNI